MTPSDITISRVVEAIGKCMVGSSLEEQAKAALDACHHAELVEALTSACTLLGAHAALYRKEGEENAQILESEASAYRRHLAKLGGQ